MDAVPLQDIGYCLMADFVPQIAQSANDPPVSPTAIVPCHLEHQLLDGLTPVVGNNAIRAESAPLLGG